MLPDFSAHGYLPPGIHPASLAEILQRFGSDTELRRVQGESLGWTVDLARQAGAKRIVVNGSFVTAVEDPNDIDCVLLIDASFSRNANAVSELIAGLPFVNLDMVDEDGFAMLTERFFATDRNLVPKGMVEVIDVD